MGMILTDSNNELLNEIYRIAKQQSDQEEREAHVAELLSYYLEFRPEDAKAWMLYGDALRVLGRKDDAFQALSKAFDGAPQKQKGYIAAQIAMLFEQHVSPLEAEEWYKIAINSLGSEIGWPWILRGANLSSLNRFEEAITCFQIVANSEADEKGEALLNLGLVYRAMREYDKAKDYFLQALVIQPGYEEARNALLGLEGMSETFDLIRHLHNCPSGLK